MIIMQLQKYTKKISIIIKKSETKKRIKNKKHNVQKYLCIYMYIQ